MLNLFSMLMVVIKRLRHNLGLTISSLIGMISVLNLVVCVPIFSHAVSGELLRRQLAERAVKEGRPLFSMRVSYADFDSPLFDVDLSNAAAEYIEARITDLTGLRIDQAATEIRTPDLEMTPVSVGRYDDPDEPLDRVSFVSMKVLPAHTRVVAGEWPEADTSASGPIRVAVHEVMADEMGLNVGDRFLLLDSIEIDIASIWLEIDPRDPIWFLNPAFNFSNAVWIPEETYRARVDTMLNDSVGSVSWYFVMDERDLRFQRAQRYARAIMRLENLLNSQLPNDIWLHSPLEELMIYQERAESLTTLLYAVGAPMAVLALLFIVTTSNIAIERHMLEVAAIRSRGTSRLQVVMMNLMESLVLMIVALPLSFVSGWYAADVMSKTFSFLEFTTRPPPPLSYEGLNFLLIGGAVALIVGARFVPALGASRRTIVKMKQEQSRRITRPLWQRFYVDLLFLVLGVYAYLVLRGWATPKKLAAQLRPTGEPYRDPLLFIAPALFAMAACLITLRVVPLVARALAALVRRLPGVSAYLSLHQIARRPRDHASGLLLIMISLSLAIFSASAANTLDQWLVDSAYYGAGADLVVREAIPGTPSSELPKESVSNGGSTGSETFIGVTSADIDIEDSMWYLDLQQHLKLPGVQHATRVGKYSGRFSAGRGEVFCWIMGIDRIEFSKVAFFRDDFASVSLGALMNALGAEPTGVLIPSYLAAEKGLGVGDRLSMVVDVLDVTYVRDLAVVGLYDYFPTVFPDELPVLVVNLEHIFGNPDAVTEYDIWLDLTEDADIPLLVDEIRKTMSVEVRIQANAFEAIERGQDQPERLGLFGVLNIGFLTAGLMPGIGFVLYSYASLRRRFIHLGMLQAIGLLVRQLVGYLVSEQLLLMGIATLNGAAVGLGTSYLFVPFLQTGASPGGQVPPFQISIGWTEAGWLSLGFAGVLFLTTLGTIAYLARIKVFQAVKLGEAL
jgi:putative ABC transport system permease protein